LGVGEHAEVIDFCVGSFEEVGVGVGGVPLAFVLVLRNGAVVRFLLCDDDRVSAFCVLALFGSESSTKLDICGDVIADGDFVGSFLLQVHERE
jgi:hypothetical protein